MKTKSRNLKAFSIICAPFALIFANPAMAAADKYAVVEFDNRMLWGTPGEKNNADLSRFTEGNPAPPGNFKVDLYLNDEMQRSSSVKFVSVANKTSAIACFTAKDFSLLRIDVSKLPEPEAKWVSEGAVTGECRLIDSVVPGASVNFDFSEQRLETFIPQAYLTERPKDYISPLEWDRGITAARLNYSLDAFNASSYGNTSTQGFAYFESGVNLEGWRIRNISSLAVDGENRSYQNQRTYAQTDVERLSSTLTVGQNYTDGQLFDAYGLQGAFISTDMRMLPSSLRSYAPVVTGAADSNAKLTIKQGSVIIYERAVPPGPFEIKNLMLSGYGNDLEVTVTEADGSIKSFTVPYSPLVQLLRPGQSKYSASLGEAWAPSSRDFKPMVGQVNFQHGVNNYVTAFGGVVGSEDYQAVALGSAVSTYIGGISADYTYSSASLGRADAINGDSIRFVYSTLYEPTGTNLTLSSYRFSSRGFWSFSEFVSSQDSRFRSDLSESNLQYDYRAKQKGRFDMNLRQRLPYDFGAASISGSTRNFWNRKGSDTQFQLSYANRFRDLSYDVALSRVKDKDDRRYNEFRLNFSMPIFATDYGRNYVSASTTRNSESGSYGQVQLGGIAGNDQEYTYGISTTQGLDSQNASANYGLNGTYQGSKGFVTSGYTKGDDYQQASLGVSGSVLVHDGGVTLGQTLGETVALIEAKDADGARITNSSGAVVDGRGYGVVPYLSAYSRNRVEIDSEGLSSDISIADTSSESVPVAGSIVKVKFETLRENTIIINGMFEDGSALPFGAEVFNNASGNVVGYVGQAGSIFARGVDAQGKLLVKLDGRSCMMAYKFNKQDSAANLGTRASGKDSNFTICKYE